MKVNTKEGKKQEKDSDRFTEKMNWQTKCFMLFRQANRG